jgi:hypothetical protein
MRRQARTKVGKKAIYKGHVVSLNSRDEKYYYAIYYGPISASRAPTDLMIGMANVAKGEYAGRIPIDDPDLTIQE